MKESSYSFSKIHLPEDKVVVKRLKKLSFLTAILTMIIAGVLLLTSSNLWLVIIAFILISFSILSESRLGFFLEAEKSSKPQKRFFLFVYYFCGISVLAIGLLEIFGKNTIEGNSVSLVAGLCLALISLSLMLARIKNVNRFYLVDLLVFVVLIINAIALLGNIYQFLSPSKLPLGFMPFGLAVIFVMNCISILLRWSDRGFVGIYTTDSISSKFSLRLLFINIIVTFLFGAVTLIGMKNEVYSSHEIVAVLTILFIVLSASLSWINLKLLYRHELERFLMKEKLRVHNITVSLDNEDLANKMSDLEGRNKDYADKLNSQIKLMDITENMP